MASPEPATTSGKLRGGAGQHAQVVVVQAIDDGHGHALGAQRLDAPADRLGPLRDDAVVDQADAAAARGIQLRLHHPHQVGIGHRRQRMVLHRAVRQQHVADEQVALEDRCARSPGRPA